MSCANPPAKTDSAISDIQSALWEIRRTLNLLAGDYTGTQHAREQFARMEAAVIRASSAADANKEHIPPICATVEDVRRAAPEPGVYVIQLDGCAPFLSELHRSGGGIRCGYWQVFGSSLASFDEDRVGARIGPRIVMPGEG